MNITNEKIDALNAVVTVVVTKDDYSEKVEKILSDYRKKANIPGFRKGAVPKSLIQKQYGKAVLLEEVNKLLQESLNNYLVEEKIEILGNPLPKSTEDFNWDAQDYTFEFELGLTPAFEIDLTAKNKLVKYTITADDTMIDEQVERIQKQYGKLISKDTVEEEDDIKGIFTNEDKGIENEITISLEVFKDKNTAKKFIGRKVGDVLTLKTKDLFKDEHDIMHYLKVSHDNAHVLDIDVNFTITAISRTELAVIDQELLDKLFGEEKITSTEQLKEKIKADAEKQFATQADQKFLNDVTQFLLENTKFDLPAVFLKKWIQTVGEKPLTPQEAEEEYTKSENGLRYQLIEGKIIADHNLKITFDDLKMYTSEMIKKQMLQFGQTTPIEADVEGIVARVLSNQEEVKRISDQVMSEKMLQLFNDKVKAKNKSVTYQEFIKTASVA